MKPSWRGRGATAVVLALTLVVTVFGITQLGPSQVVVASLNTDWSCRQRDKELGIAVYEPGCRGTRDLGQGPVPFGINQAGFRGEPPRLGARKILLMGGSTMVGPGLGNKREPGELLELEFHQLGLDVDVLNLSVEGYTTTQHAILFGKQLRKYKPELVILDTLSAHKSFLDLVLRHTLIRNDAGLPKRLVDPNQAWGKRLNSLMPKGMRAWARTLVVSSQYLRTSRSLRDLDDQGLAEVLATWQQDLLAPALALAAKRGTHVLMIWDSSTVENQRALRVQEVATPARALGGLTPKLTVSAEAMTAALKDVQLPLIMPNSLPQPGQAEMHIGDLPYYSTKGLQQYVRSLARAVNKRGLL